jgi:RND family efflux transporter MFP subunit
MTMEGNTQSAKEGSYQPAQKNSRLFLFLVGIVVVLVIVGIFTMLQHREQYNALAKETEKLAVPTVAVIHPTVEPSQEDLILPSTLQAYTESPIYARTTGYLKKWNHDIGSHVQRGELLAEIETPEVDQQLSQARADLGTMQANENLSRITAARYEELIKTDGVSKQEVDNAVGDYAARRAAVASAQANVRRLEELESFKRVYAPFSGVVTRRNVDIGNLINAGNGGAAQELFVLASTDPIRAYISVPELYAPAVHPGVGAYLELTLYPGQKFQAKVVRTADAIDLASRTLNTEVDVPNKDGQLLPGGYAQVHLLVGVKGTRLQVPVNALLFRAEGLRAPVVDGNNRVHLRQLAIGRDYGTALEVLQGLSPEDWIVLNPPDSLDEGMQVNVKQMPQNAAPAAPAGGATPQHGNVPPNANGNSAPRSGEKK